MPCGFPEEWSKAQFRKALEQLKKDKIVIKDSGSLKVVTEDGGVSKIGEVAGEVYINDERSKYDTVDEGIYVRIISWNEDKDHPTMDSLKGKRLRITIQVVD